MKKLICVLVSLTVLLTLGFSVIATQADEPQVLSELSDEELLAFLVANGVEIPTRFESDEECIAFARRTIEAVEQDSNARFHYGYIYLQDFSDAIIAAVCSYYGDNATSTFANVYGSESIVQDNDVVGTWNTSYGGYNCYAYAIGCSYSLEPGWIAAGYDPETDPTPGIMYDIITDMVDSVIDDLEYLEYTGISYGPLLVVPTGGITEHRRLICLRWETLTGGDFHFMVLEEDDSWYHKPGQSTPLRYKYTPSNDSPWVLEGLDSRGYFRNEDKQYAGPIYYISYTIPCSYQYQYSSNDKHIRICQICDKTTGGLQSCAYVNNRCRLCGHLKNSGAIIQSVCEQNDQ